MAVQPTGGDQGQQGGPGGDPGGPGGGPGPLIKYT